MSVKIKKKHESYKVTILWFARAILYRLSGKAGPVLYMIKNRQTPNKTICNILNDIYHGTKDKNIQLMALEASFMAKRMDNRLKVYKHNEEITNASLLRKKGQIPK